MRTFIRNCLTMDDSSKSMVPLAKKLRYTKRHYLNT